MSTDKKKSFKPTDYFGNIISMTVTLLIAWVMFNVLLVFFIWFVVRLTHYDTDPNKVWAANKLTQNRMIDLQQVAPGIQTIRHVYRLDTDGDGFEEWLVLYSYDSSTAGKADVRPGPYGAAIYDPDQCRPPAIVSYELRPYDYDYVGENVSIWWGGQPEMIDVNADGKLELVLHIGNNLSVFRWFGLVGECSAIEAQPQGYRALGTFRGTGGVSLGTNGQIVVLDRGFFDRSQIATERLYAPDKNGSYLLPEGGGLYPPKEVGLTFEYGQTISMTQSYYPEKTVLAFYLNLGQKDKAADALLCPDVRKTYPVNRDSFGVALPHDQLARVLVKEIAYTPNPDAERLHMTREVTVVVVGVSKKDVADEEHPQRVVWTVRGVPREGALPYNGEWCLESYRIVN